jgi:hypothetical protein
VQRASTIHAVRNPMRVRIATNASEARRLRRGGYCPVECSFGAASVVDRLCMDHHGRFSDLSAVAVRAYTRHFAVRTRRPRFVVTGYADEDVTWAIASLAGLLPHPSRDGEFRNAPAEMRRAWTRDWTKLADLISRMDVDPEGIELRATREGRMMLLWRLRGSFPLRDPVAFYAGIDRWRSLLTQVTREELSQAPRLLDARLKKTGNVRHERFGSGVVLVDSSIWGFSTVYAQDWFRRLGGRVLFVFQPRPSGKGNVTVCARDARTARSLYGERGLLDVFEQLRPRGWGGRPTIGGSHRGRPITLDQAREAARLAADLAR